MRTVARLVLTYFTATAGLRAFSVIGLVLGSGIFYALRAYGQSDLRLSLAMASIFAIFIGSSLMPLMVGRMACGRSVCVLPGGRLTLLVSALLTVALVSLPLPIFLVFGHQPFTLDPAIAERAYRNMLLLFWITYTSCFLFAAWFYVALWFITSQRTTAGFFKGLLIIAVIIFAPVREITNLDASLRRNLIECALVVLVFAAGFLLWPRWRALAARVRARIGAMGLSRGAVSGREIDLLLGTANPWWLAAAQILPIALAARIGFYSAAVWLFYLTIFSTVAGAIAGQAAERSRMLWLRGNWSRGELFSRVERSFWRHNSYVLAMLLALMLAIGAHAGLPPKLLAAGLPLLILGTVLSTYLGLMVTRGLHWLESVLAIVLMLALMAVAVLAARSSGDLHAVIALEVILMVAALVLRSAARKRWLSIDWMMCRPDRALSVRAAG